MGVRAAGNRRRRLAVAVGLVVVAAVALVAVVVPGREASTPSPPSAAPDARDMSTPSPPTTSSGADVVWAAEPGTTSTRLTGREPSTTLPLEGELLQDPRTDPLPAWSAFDPETGGFLWTDMPVDSGVAGVSRARTFVVLSPDADSEGLTQISCAGLCSDVLSFGPGPDEVTVLVTDTEKDPVNPGPASLARVYGLDGSLRDEIDLADVMGTERHLLEETNDWAPPDGSEALITDIEWAPDGTRLAVSTHPGFFEPECPPPAARPCEALVWTFDREGGDPVPIHRQLSRGWERRVLQTPILTSLAWTPDGSRLGMVLLSGNQARSKRPPSVVGLDVESGHASTLHEFDECGTCWPVRYGFTWAPDGTRLAVTSGEGIRLLDSDGTVLGASADGGPGPLAWLVKAH